MEQEKSMFSFDKKNRIIETKDIAVPIMTPHGWDTIMFTHEVITGWNMPVVREEKI